MVSGVSVTIKMSISCPAVMICLSSELYLSFCKSIELVISRAMVQKQEITEEEVRGTLEAIASTGKFWYLSSLPNFY